MIAFADLLTKIKQKKEIEPIPLPVKQYEVSMLFNNTEFQQPVDVKGDYPLTTGQISVHLLELIKKGVIERKRIGGNERKRYAYKIVVDKSLITKVRENRANEVIDLVRDNPGIGMQDLAKKMRTNYEGPRYYINNLVKKGVIRRETTVNRAKKSASKAYKFYLEAA